MIILVDKQMKSGQSSATINSDAKSFGWS